MYVIVLKGEGHGGKTTTLNFLKDEFDKENWKLVETAQYGINPEDAHYVFSKDDNKVGIITYGDIQRDTMRTLFKIEKQYNPSVVIMAYNSKFVKQPYRRYEHYVFYKTVAFNDQEQENVNKKDASELWKLIQTHLEL